MQILLIRGHRNVMKRLPRGENPGYRYKITSVGDFVEKLEHFIGFDFNTCAFMLIYAN